MRILENELSSRKAESAFPHADEAERLGLIPHADGYAPTAPKDLRGTGLGPLVVRNLLLKTAYTVPQFTTEWAARRLHLPGTGNLRGLAPHNLPGIAIANRLQ